MIYKVQTESVINEYISDRITEFIGKRAGNNPNWISEIYDKRLVPPEFNSMQEKLHDAAKSILKTALVKHPDEKVEKSLEKFFNKENKRDKTKVHAVVSVQIKNDILDTLELDHLATMNKIAKQCGFKPAKKVIADPFVVQYFTKKSSDKDVIITAFTMDTGKVSQVGCICCKNDDKLKYIYEATNSSSEEFGYASDNEDKTITGMKSSDYTSVYDSLGLQRSEDLNSDKEYSDFFRDPKIMAAFTEHFDMTDRMTRKVILGIHEAEAQGTLLTTLTSKLYDNIVNKVDDIDYGDIPMTKGDITLLPNYEKLRDCIQILRDILKEYKQDTAPIDEISTALANVECRKDAFMRAFKYSSELPIITYNNTVLAIISSVSYMIATSIEFIKTPNRDNFEITLDKVGYAKSKGHMLFTDLKKFNVMCKKGELDKILEYILNNRIKTIGESMGMKSYNEISTNIIIAGVSLILLCLIPFLRDLVYLFFSACVKVSDFFDIQADMLQMNAYNVQNDETRDETERSHIAAKQLKRVSSFRKIADFFNRILKRSEVETQKNIKEDSNKQKINELEDDIPGGISALF